MGKIYTLNEARKKKGILIATHRGMVAGNIPHNTIPAFEAALLHGTDMIETDITLTKDGVPVIFHPKQEINQLNQDVHIEQMTLDQVQELRYVNDCRAKTEWGIITLDDLLEHYKNRCFINLDHAWDYFSPVINAVRRHKMEDQILLKSPGRLQYAEVIEELAPDMMYMPICKEVDNISDALEQMNVNYTGIELVFAQDNSPLVNEEYLQEHHNKGRLLWGNAILYNYMKPLSGGHTDDVAVTGDPDGSWGWLANKGFDIIQTDWTLPLKQYLTSKGL